MKIPDGMEKYINDYKIQIFEVAWLTEEEIERFQSDFRIVANFFTQKRKNKDYIPDDPTEIKYVDEVLKLLNVMTGDKRYEKIFQKKKGVRSMWDLQEEKFQIPPLTIQPLVENAVCHGICQKMEGGTVQIRSFRKNGEICVQILDDGAGFDTEKLKDADGIAIRNLKLRLKEFLNADLEIESRKGEGCRQTIHIPWEETEDENYSDR